jgi:hypothetical protein
MRRAFESHFHFLEIRRSQVETTRKEELVVRVSFTIQLGVQTDTFFLPLIVPDPGICLQ